MKKAAYHFGGIFIAGKQVCCFFITVISEAQEQKNFCFFYMYRRKLVIFADRPNKQIKIETTCLQKEQNEI